MTITEGPINWIGVNGHNHGEYLLFKTTSFPLNLDPIADVYTGTISERTTSGAPTHAAMAQRTAAQGVTTQGVDAAPVIPADSVGRDFHGELSLQEVVGGSKPALVYRKGLNQSGTAFFVTETGVIATNAHVTRAEEGLLAVLPGGL
jgi:hypothetical protein